MDRSEGVSREASAEEIFESVFGRPAPDLPPARYPVRFAGARRGEILIQPGRGAGPDQLDREALLALLAPFLTAESVAELAALAPGADWIDTDQLAALGYEAVFDETDLTFEIIAPLDFQTEQTISLRGQGLSVDVDRVEPADYALAINGFIGLTAAENALERDDDWLESLDFTVNGAAYLRGWALEGGFTYNTDFEDLRDFTRGDVRMTRDFPETIVRFQAGDLLPEVSGLQTSPTLAGVSVFRFFNLRPFERFSPTPERRFEILRPARVEVFVNDRFLQELRLAPGRYRLTDLPLQSAAGNDVRIAVRYNDGQVEVFEFPAFFDVRLLRPGLSEFAATLGVASRFDGGDRTYDADEVIFSGFYRRGLSEAVTAGFDFQADSASALAGGEVLTATRVGVFGVLGAVNVDRLAMESASVTGLYRWAGVDPARQALADLQVRYSGADYRPLQASEGRSAEYEARGRFGINLSEATRLQISGDAERVRESGDVEYALEAGVSRALRFGSLTLAARYEDNRDESEFTVRAAWTARLGGGTVSASYDGAGDRLRASYNRALDPGVEQVGYSATVNSNDDLEEIVLSGAYRGNRFEAGFDQRIAEAAPDEALGSALRTNITIGSALALVGGQIALSRPINDSFAIVRPSEAVEAFTFGVDRLTVPGAFEQTYNARADAFGPAVAPDLSAYLVRVVEVEPLDAPAGISVGRDVYVLQPPFRGGYLIEVGDAGNIALLGVLADETGAPLPYATGTVHISDGDGVVRQPLFTNAAGRFYVDRVRPGAEVVFHLDTVPPRRAAVRAPEDAIGVIRYTQPIEAVLADLFEGDLLTPPYRADTDRLRSDGAQP